MSKRRTVRVEVDGIELTLLGVAEWETLNGFGYSGLLCLGEVEAAHFEQRGEGGCNIYRWRDREAQAKIEGAARRAIPSMPFEQLDAVINGALDGCSPAQVDAYMRGEG